MACYHQSKDDLFPLHKYILFLRMGNELTVKNTTLFFGEERELQELYTLWIKKTHRSKYIISLIIRCKHSESLVLFYK